MKSSLPNFSVYFYLIKFYALLFFNELIFQKNPSSVLQVSEFHCKKVIQF